MGADGAGLQSKWKAVEITFRSPTRRGFVPERKPRQREGLTGLLEEQLSVLRDLGAPGFLTLNTAAQLSEIFANLRSQNLDLSRNRDLDLSRNRVPKRLSFRRKWR